MAPISPVACMGLMLLLATMDLFTPTILMSRITYMALMRLMVPKASMGHSPLRSRPSCGAYNENEAPMSLLVDVVCLLRLCR